ncbi:HECT-like ubiquitin-conjugating enzyme-binding-domain-containing protein [Irpex rosettiformis]|uniref:HECT-like ubiquitin-conjugating enzyme-binding-domain-containing protein n=1 Tax=Irpex rosettiformis TaxID=378272 RepID=A0ACB8U7Z6_9APHY|nr:HECT-like ubiquitin-conjugating enzyme-binding-domain-containing protein [Irpex rosettiformis]
MKGNPYAALQRQVSDFQLERSSTPDSLSRGATPVQAVEAALLWSEVDAELEQVLELCCSRPIDDPFVDSLPPEYDAADYELPRYEPRTLDDDLALNSKSSYKAGSVLGSSSSRLYDSANEKMRMDLEAVTLAIDRLYSVAPQLHNQRVELKQTKVRQMERAKLKGKQRATDEDMNLRDLDKMLGLINKASERKMNDQAVFVDESAMKRKLEAANQRVQEKRAAFVEQLASHSEAGRMHSQDASFIQPSHRSRSQPTLVDDTHNPHALLSLPEFIREGIPDTVQHRMQLERDPEALLSLPEFMKEHPIPQSFKDSQNPPAAQKVKGHRSRSMSEPLAWLLSAKPSSSSNGSGLGIKRRGSKRHMRPESSSGTSTPIIEEALEVSYVAEYHENLHHVFVFLEVSGLRAGFNLEAEVVPHSDAGPGHLYLKCDTITSPPLTLPAQVSPGPATVSVVGGRYYQIKLSTPNLKKPGQTSPSDSTFTHDLLDASHFQTVKPTSFICSSCSLPLVRASQVSRYRDLPSEHWAELVDAWMCHTDQKLHEHVQKGSKEGFWPGPGEALVGGSYVLIREDSVVKVNLNSSMLTNLLHKVDDWHRIRCICGAIVGRCRQHNSSEGSTMVYRLAKYAFRPVSPTSEPSRVPLSAFIVEDMNEYVHAHATYRFIIMDEEQERPRILAWLFKPNMRIAYAVPNPYVIPKNGSFRVAKVLFKIVGPAMGSEDLQTLLNKHPGFPQAEHLYYPMDICRRLAVLLKESNLAYPESMRTMTGLDVGWLQRA